MNVAACSRVRPRSAEPTSCHEQQLAAGLQARQAQRRCRAADENEPRRDRQAPQQQIHRPVDLFGLDHMVIIEHQDERARRCRKVFDQLLNDLLGITPILGEERSSAGREIPVDKVQRGEDQLEKALRFIVGRLQPHPGRRQRQLSH
jgi:hypothetical protein